MTIRDLLQLRGLCLWLLAGYPSALSGEPKKIGDPVDISDELAPLRGVNDKYPQ